MLTFSTFPTKTIAMTVAGVALAGAGVTTALAYGDTPEHTSAAAVERAVPHPAGKTAAAFQDRLLLQAPAKPAEPVKPATKAKPAKRPALPMGVSTATSFWDPETASGKPMSYHTLASPYWPLGTTVKITYKGKSEIGVVEDYGPAEWAVAQHNPPALIDLSEKMMEHLTGAASNSVTIKFQVLRLGKGGVYRHSGTGYGTATGKS